MPEILPGNLTERDMEILNILWESTESMTASQLIEADPTLTINMVQAVLRRLLKKNLIQVDKIVYSRTALCRSYSPTVSASEFTLLHIGQEYQKLRKHISISTLMASLLKGEKDPETLQQDIDELHTILEQYKRQ